MSDEEVENTANSASSAATSSSLLTGATGGVNPKQGLFTLPSRPAEKPFDWDELPANWIPEDANVKWVTSQVTADHTTILRSNMRSLYGTTVSSVASAFLEALFMARIKQKPAQLVIDLVVAVLCAFTVSRDVVSMYERLCKHGMWSQFEIGGQRIADVKKPVSNWVKTSAMNATALNIMGHIVAHHATKNSALKRKAEEVGTIFSPVQGVSEFAKLTFEASKDVTKADEAIVVTAGVHGVVIFDAVCSILNQDAVDTTKIVGLLTDYQMKKF